MEQNIPIIARKVWQLVRVAFFMLRKGICKKKLLMCLNTMSKHGKLAGKALDNLISHLHHHHASTSHDGASPLNHQPAAGEYEFSCSSTPVSRHYFSTKRKNHRPNMPFLFTGDEDIDNVNMNKVVEMMAPNDIVGASPALPSFGFGWSPMPARQLRVSDSPFPVQNMEEDNHVDEAAEAFIKRFYSQLKRQN